MKHAGAVKVAGAAAAVEETGNSSEPEVLPEVEAKDLAKEVRAFVGKHGLRVAARVALEDLLRDSESLTAQAQAKLVVALLTAKESRTAVKKAAKSA